VMLVPDAAFYLEYLIRKFNCRGNTLFLSRNDKELVIKDYLTYGVKEDWSHDIFELTARLPSEVVISLNVLLSSMLQIKQFNKIITNRLHAHILCVMMEVEHALLSNSYHKNESFYETWTYSDVKSKFIK